MMTAAKSREFLMFWDVTLANPNGDMLDENKPRHDEQTGKLEVSDVRIKRFIRDELDAKGHKILVRTVTDDKGKVMSCTSIIKGIMDAQKLKDTTLPAYLIKEYTDVKLFGATITKPKYDIVGPLQVMWSRSINKPEIKFVQGSAAYASSEGKEQASIWSKYMVEYAIFRTYAVFNSEAARMQNIEVTEDDINLFISGFIDGLKNYRSTSKNQMPRMIVEVIYKNHRIDGELDYVAASYDCEDEDLRSISQVSFDFSKLNAYYEANKENIEKIKIYKHWNLELPGVPESFEVVTM